MASAPLGIASDVSEQEIEREPLYFMSELWPRELWLSLARTILCSHPKMQRERKARKNLSENEPIFHIFWILENSKQDLYGWK